MSNAEQSLEALTPTEPWMEQGELVEVGGRTYFLSRHPDRRACHIGRWERGLLPGSGTVRSPKTIWGCAEYVFKWHPFAAVRWALEFLARAGRPLS